MKLLLIDNYDSFTYNLEHYLRALELEVHVLRNDQFEIEEVSNFDFILISPGPGLPVDAGKTLQVIEKYALKIPMLGVCLGAQAIAEFFGAELYNQKEVAHGIARKAYKLGDSWLLDGLESQFNVGLYHSWAIEAKEAFSKNFKIVAERENQTLMAFEHSKLALAGIQFHPESIMTEGGKKILSNWIRKAQA